MVTALLYCVAMGRNPIRNLFIVALGSLVFLLAIPETYKKKILSIKETDSGTAECGRFFWQASRNMWWCGTRCSESGPETARGISVATDREQTATGMFSGAQFGERTLR
jgi:hypothetical protein